MNTKEKEFLNGFAAYLETRMVEYNMHQDFSIHFRDDVIGFNCIWVQLNYRDKPYIYSYIGYCPGRAEEAEEFEEELEDIYLDYRFYSDRYGYRFEIGLSKEFEFVSYEDVHRRVMEMENVVLEGFVLGQRRFKGGFTR